MARGADGATISKQLSKCVFCELHDLLITDVRFANVQVYDLLITG